MTSTSERLAPATGRAPSAPFSGQATTLGGSSSARRSTLSSIRDTFGGCRKTCCAEMRTQFSLDGCVAVVTGGSGAIGSALAGALASAGAVVGVLARNTERIAATVDAVAAAGGEACALPADVLDQSALERARDTMLERYARIDVL